MKLQESMLLLQPIVGVNNKHLERLDESSVRVRR